FHSLPNTVEFGSAFEGAGADVGVPAGVERAVGQQDSAAEVEDGEGVEAQGDAAEGVEVARGGRDDDRAAEQVEQTLLPRRLERQRLSGAVERGRRERFARRALRPRLEQG